MAGRSLPDHPTLGFTAHPVYLDHPHYGLDATWRRLAFASAIFGAMLVLVGGMVTLCLRDRGLTALFVGDLVITAIGCYAVRLWFVIGREAAIDHRWIRQVRDGLQ